MMMILTVLAGMLGYVALIVLSYYLAHRFKSPMWFAFAEGLNPETLFESRSEKREEEERFRKKINK